MTPVFWAGVSLFALGFLPLSVLVLGGERADSHVVSRCRSVFRACSPLFVVLCLAGAVTALLGLDGPREAKGRDAQLVALPPGAVVLEEQAPTWWRVSVGGKTYLAQWVYSGRPHWQLTPAD